LNPAAGTDAGHPPKILLPKPERLFRQRVQRLRDLAATVPGLSGYLLLMAELAERQAEFMEAPPSSRSIAAGWQVGAEDDPTHELRRGPALTPILRRLVQGFEAPSAAVKQVLAHIVGASDADVETWVSQLRMAQPTPEDSAVLPFVAAALQIELVRWAAEGGADDLGQSAELGVCPVCHGEPVASILRTVGETPGLRYLHCGFCASEWPYPRIQCIQCGTGEHIAYQGIEGADQAIQAETCDACHVYLKRIDRDKSPGADPLADDIATLTLDVLLNEQGYQRFGFNPLMIIPVGA
jgi:FdhE protein